MQRIFECGGSQHNSLTPNTGREPNIFIYGSSFLRHHAGVVSYKNGPVFLAHPVFAEIILCLTNRARVVKLLFGVVPPPSSLLLISALPLFLPLPSLTPTSSWRSPFNSAKGVVAYCCISSQDQRIPALQIYFNSICVFNFVILDNVPSFSLGGR